MNKKNLRAPECGARSEVIQNKNLVRDNMSSRKVNDC